MQTEESLIRLSGDDIIELIQEHRNGLIKKLMDIDSLKEFLCKGDAPVIISNIKLEFIKRALKELMSTSVDLSHYGPLILEIRKTGSMSVSKNNAKYFSQDIERAIENYR